jgi:hypothetical protein
VHVPWPWRGTGLGLLGLKGGLAHVRALHGVAPVWPSAQLQFAATHHSDDMMVHDYFAAASPAGSSVYSPIVGSGFLTAGSAARRWPGAPAPSRPRSAPSRPGLPAPTPHDHALTHLPLGRISRTCGIYEGHASACVWTADWVERW